VGVPNFEILKPSRSNENFTTTPPNPIIIITTHPPTTNNRTDCLAGHQKQKKPTSCTLRHGHKGAQHIHKFALPLFRRRSGPRPPDSANFHFHHDLTFMTSISLNHSLSHSHILELVAGWPAAHKHA